jgi:ribosomal protein L7Ae-like RNA K-turn-binding protein
VAGPADAVRALVGQAQRCRATAIGREACRRAARRGQLHALLLATDAGRSAARDCGWRPPVPLLQSGLDKNELGELVGRATLAALGITVPALANGLVRITARVPQVADRDVATDDDTRG